MSVDIGPASNAWTELWSIAQQMAADSAEFDALASYLGSEAIAGTGAVVGAAAVTISLPEIAIGVFCVIILVCFITLIVRPLATALGGLPFVGDAVKGAVNKFGDWLILGEQTVITWAFGGIAGFLTAVVTGVWAFCKGVTHGAEAVVSTVWWIVDTFVPSVLGQALTHADQVAQQAENSAISWATGVFDNVYTELHLVESQLPQIEQNAITTAEGWASGIFSNVYTELHAIENSAAQNFQQVEQEIGDLVQSIPLQLGHLETTVEQFATQAATDAANAVEAALGPAIAAVATAVAGFGGNLKNYLDNCGNDMCKANGQNAKNVNNLATDIGAAALFAFVAACIKEPNPMADASFTILQPVIGFAGGTADALLGAAVA